MEAIKLFRTILFNLLGWAVLIVGMFFFGIYRACIDVILKIKWGPKYGGLFDKYDLVMCIKDQSKMCITAVLYVKSTTKFDVMKSLKEILQKQIFDHPEFYPKLNNSKKDFGGYPYWIKNGCKVTDVLRPLKVPKNVNFDENYLKEITSEIVSSEYAKNGSILWEMYVNEEPLNCDNNENDYRYPVIIRFHHAIADGTSLVSLLLRIFGDQVAENYGDNIFRKFTKKEPKEQGEQKITIDLIKSNLINLIEKLSFWFDVIFLSLGRFVEWNHFRPKDSNSLHSVNYSEKKIAVWAIEDRAECVPMVKKIKNRANSQFSRVLCTAISASISNYFRKHSELVPNYLMGLLTSILFYTPNNPSKPIQLLNKTSVNFFELPTTDEDENLLQTLRQVTKTMAEQATIADTLMSRFVIGFAAGYFPPIILPPFVGFAGETFVLTNVPGVAKTTVLGGRTLEKIVPVAPNVKALGVTFTVLTYDDRFQIGLLVDEVLVKSRPEIQSLADDVLRYIKLMDAECRKKLDNYY